MAVNSYRGNGGGGHLTIGAGIPDGELASRIIRSTDRDLRYHLMEFLAQQDTLHPVLRDNWKFTPAKQAEEAIRSDRLILEQAMGF